MTLVLFSTLASGQGVSAKARLYAPLLCKHAASVFGPNPPCASVLGLVEQESAFNAEALSRVGAKGPGQFMPVTAEAMCRNYPTVLCPAKPNDWEWSAKAISYLLKESMDRLASNTASDCSAGLMSYSEYNGGPTALARERALCQVDAECDTKRWFDHVETHKSRAQWAFDENRDYVLKVFQRSVKYANAGMGRAWCH